MQNTTLEKVIAAIVRVLPVDERDVTPQATFRGDLEADELDMVEIMMELEDVFNLPELDDECMDLPTVQALADYIDSQLKREPSVAQLGRALPS